MLSCSFFYCDGDDDDDDDGGGGGGGGGGASFKGKDNWVAKLSYAMRTCSPLSLMEVQVQFDKALRTSLEKIVTALGRGLGISSGGLPLSQSTWANILSRTCIVSHGSSFQYVVDAFNDICNVDIFSVTITASAPQMMKTLAQCYFGAIEKDLVSRYALSPGQVGIVSCIRGPHAHDFLLTIPIDGLGIIWCVIFLLTYVSKSGSWCVKSLPMGFLSRDGKDLRPADLLLFNWLQGKDACVDVTDISPFAGMGANS
nr:CAAX amino terminal protease [Tanacetum cinerariifolium]